MRGFIPPSEESELILCKKAQNAAQSAMKSGAVRTMPFMNEREQELCVSALNKVKCKEYFFWGGHESTLRKMLAIGDDMPSKEHFDIQLLAITPNFSKISLTHRDYLGALMSLGITRDYIGDIIVLDNMALVFSAQKFAALICEELTAVKNVNVNARVATQNEENLINAVSKQSEKTLTIASLRLDAILAAMLKTSRKNAADLIRAKYVMINHIKTQNCSFEVQEGDVFSIKGKGKFRLNSVGNKSKKNRIFINFTEY